MHSGTTPPGGSKNTTPRGAPQRPTPTAQSASTPGGRSGSHEHRTPVATRSLGQQAAQVFSATPPPFGLPSTRQQAGRSQRGSVLIGGTIGQSKTLAMQLRTNTAALQTLFGGQPPLVERKAVNGRPRYRWPAGTPPEPFHHHIATVCGLWLASPETQDEAIELLNAVWLQAGTPGTWLELLPQHGEALVQAKHLSPQDVLAWVRRLHQLAQRARAEHQDSTAQQALAWAQQLVHGLGPATKGPAANALALLRRWEREASTAQGACVRVGNDPPPPFTLDAPESGPDPQTPRPARTAWPMLPALASADDASGLASGEPDWPLCRCLQAAQLSGDYQAFADALRERRHIRRGGPVSEALITDLNRALRLLLEICEDPRMDAPVRTELLRLAYPLVTAHRDDPRIASEYSSAVRQWLPPEDAEHLLLALGEPVDSLAPNHLYRIRLRDAERLQDWGLPAPLAKRLAFDPQQVWAYELLFQVWPAVPVNPARQPLLSVQGGGPTLNFVLNPAASLFNDAQVDAVLVLCEAWQHDAPELAMKLLSATRSQALSADKRKDKQLLPRWSALVRGMQQHTFFAPWLSVQREFDPVSGRFSELKCQLDAELANKATPQELQRVNQGLWAWVKKQLQQPPGLRWASLVRLLKAIDDGLGERQLFDFPQWLLMAAWELQRSGDAEPLRKLQPHLAELPLEPDTLLALLRVLQSPNADEVATAATLHQLIARLPPHDASLPTAELHTACLHTILARSDQDLRQPLVDRYLSKQPLAAPHASSGELLQLLSHIKSPTPPTPEQIWDSLSGLTPPSAPAAWAIWRGLCQALAPWMAQQLLAQPPQRAAQRVLETVWGLTRCELGQQPGLAAEHQFELLLDLAEAVAPEQRLAVLQQLHTACAGWQAALLDKADGRPAPPLPAWLIALQGALQALIVDRGGQAGEPGDTSGAPHAPTPLAFFCDWFAARLVARRGYHSSAQQLVERIRARHPAPFDGPVGQLIAELLRRS